jgi:plastocyanin
VRRLLAAIPVLVAVLALGAPVESAPLVREIKVVRNAPQPKELHVGVGAKVEFVNKDRRRHKIKSVRNAWPLITLAPRARAAVQLQAPGRYEYKVDGRKKGVIIAGRIIVGFTPGPGTASLTEEFRYSIRVEVAIHDKLVHSGSPNQTGTQERTMQWVGSWPSALIRIQKVARSVNFGMVPAGGARGTIRFQTVEFSDSRPLYACSGKVVYPALPAVAQLTGDPTFVNFNMSATASGRTTLDRLMDEARNSCQTADFPVWIETPDPVTPEGVRVDPPRSGIGPDDARFDRQGRLRFPIPRILAHQSFTVDTRQRAVTPRSCGTGCTESFEGRVRFIFRPLAPR